MTTSTTTILEHYMKVKPLFTYIQLLLLTCTMNTLCSTNTTENQYFTCNPTEILSIYCSLLRPVTHDDANLHASMFAGEQDTHLEIVKSRYDFSKTENIGESKPATTLLPSPEFNPQDLIFLMDKQMDNRQETGLCN
jgi:hypothetical protein